MHRAVKDYVEVAEAQGARLVAAHHTGKHMRLIFARPGGGTFQHLAPCTPSDRRGILNFRASIRRALQQA